MNEDFRAKIAQTRVGEYYELDRILTHCVQGLLCGYSECCIKFCLMRRHGEVFPQTPYLDNGVVLCPHCASNIEAAVKGIVSRRILGNPFPNSGPESWPDNWPLQIKEQSERLASEIYTLIHP